MLWLYSLFQSLFLPVGRFDQDSFIKVPVRSRFWFWLWPNFIEICLSQNMRNRIVEELKETRSRFWCIDKTISTNQDNFKQYKHSLLIYTNHYMTWLNIIWQNIHHLGDPALHPAKRKAPVRVFISCALLRLWKISPVHSLTPINITNSLRLILQTNNFLPEQKNLSIRSWEDTEVRNDFIWISFQWLSFIYVAI